MLFSIGGLTFNADFYAGHQTVFKDNKIVLIIHLSGGSELSTSAFTPQAFEEFEHRLNSFFNKFNFLVPNNNNNNNNLNVPPHLLNHPSLPPPHQFSGDPIHVFQNNVHNTRNRIGTVLR